MSGRSQHSRPRRAHQIALTTNDVMQIVAAIITREGGSSDREQIVRVRTTQTSGSLLFHIIETDESSDPVVTLRDLSNNSTAAVGNGEMLWC